MRAGSFLKHQRCAAMCVLYGVLRYNNPRAQEPLNLMGAPVGKHYKCTCIGNEAERASFTKKVRGFIGYSQFY